MIVCPYEKSGKLYMEKRKNIVRELEKRTHMKNNDFSYRVYFKEKKCLYLFFLDTTSRDTGKGIVYQSQQSIITVIFILPREPQKLHIDSCAAKTKAQYFPSLVPVFSTFHFALIWLPIILPRFILIPVFISAWNDYILI